MKQNNTLRIKVTSAELQKIHQALAKLEEAGVKVSISSLGRDLLVKRSNEILSAKKISLVLE